MGKNNLAPGFRFHPTDLELVLYYLKRKVLSKKFPVNAPITDVDIYKHAPWDLPDKSCLKTGDLKWYFFCPIAKKYGKGGRLNRATVYGYWKTTGKDRPVKHNGEVVGMKKTLVFHRGKDPSGERTDWVMHEYKLEDKKMADRGIAQDSYVLCEVFEKEGMGPKNGAQYGAPFKEEDWSDDEEEEETILPGTTSSFCGMSAAAVDGASSSLVHESHVGPSVGSSGLYNLSSDTGTSTIDTTAYAPTSAYAAPTWTSALDTTAYAPTSAYAAHTWTSAIGTTAYALTSAYVVPTWTSAIDTTAYAPTSAYAVPTWTSAIDTTAYAPTSAYAAHTWTSAIGTTAYALTSAYAVPTWTSAIDTTAYAPTSAYAAHTWTSAIGTTAYAAHTWTSAIGTTAYAPTSAYSALTWTSAIDTFAYASTSNYAAPTWTSTIDTFADAAPTFVDAHPEAPLVADPETVANAETVTDAQTVADAQAVANAETVPAFLEADVARDEEPNSNILTLLDSFHANDTFLHRDDQIKLPQVSNEDNDVASLLKSFTEVDDPSTWSYIF